MWSERRTLRKKDSPRRMKASGSMGECFCATSRSDHLVPAEERNSSHDQDIQSVTFHCRDRSAKASRRLISKTQMW